MLSVIENELNRIGLEIFFLRDSTTAKQRIEMAKYLNYGERDIFLIFLKSGGTSLNFSVENAVIFV